MSRQRLVLASASPRRHQLLSALGVSFEVRPAEIDESPLPDETVSVYVDRLARAKARVHGVPGELVLAADTAVAVDGKILGKPSDSDEAAGMLRELSGRVHQVLTSVALYDPLSGGLAAARAETTVTFAELSAEEIDWYVSTGEPRDKAGAYAIQGLGGVFVERIEGSYSNVVGLPVAAVYRLFRELGSDLRTFSSGKPIDS